MVSDETKSKAWGGSMNDWSDAARKAGIASLADQLVENEEIKFLGREGLKKLGLPHFKKIDPTPLSDFLQTPEKYFQQLEIPEYHVSLLSDVENKRRLRLGYLDRQGVLDFVHENVTADEEGKFTILIGEIKENVYSGNIIINKDGSLILEAAGPNVNHIDLVTGKVTPNFFAERVGPDKEIEWWLRRGTHRLDIEPVSLELALHETLEAIPNLCPGYYEFVLIQNGDDPTNLSPIFIDFRDKNIYQLKPV